MRVMTFMMCYQCYGSHINIDCIEICTISIAPNINTCVLYILLLLIFHLRPDVPPVLTYIVSCMRMRVWAHVLIIFLRARIRSLCAYTCKECAYFDPVNLLVLVSGIE